MRILGCGETFHCPAVPPVIDGVDDVFWWINNLGIEGRCPFDENWGMEGGVGCHDWRRRRLFGWWFDD